MASASNVSVNQPFTLVLMGRTGNGKSSTANSILGREAFHSTKSFESVTKECKMEHCTRKDGRVLNVIDTPGVFDTNVSREDVDREIVKCINLAGRGIHAILVVLSLRSRFTEEEADSIYMLQLLFGLKISNYMMIVFTGGDELHTSLQDHLKGCPMSLKGTINLCNSRMVLFNNHISAPANVKETQMTELLEQVDIIVAENGGRPYSNDLFLKAQEMSSQLYHVKDKEKQNKEQYEKDQTKLLNEMTKKNMLAMQEMLRGAKAEHEKDLESVRLAHTAAVSKIQKQAAEAQMKDLEMKELEYEIKLQNLRAEKLEIELKYEKLNQRKSERSCIIM